MVRGSKMSYKLKKSVKVESVRTIPSHVEKNVAKIALHLMPQMLEEGC